MTIAYIGNFQPDLPAELGPPWSTETHLGLSLELLGHKVIRLQEDRVAWDERERLSDGADMLLWTSTRDYARLWNQADVFESLGRIGKRMPRVGAHLDLWHSLDRAPHVLEDAYFQATDFMFTADGDHPDEWIQANVRHHWMPPGVYGPECQPGTPRVDWASDIAFIGSWSRYAHVEHWPARRRMLSYAKERWGAACQFWPREGKGAVRSQNLNDLLSSVRVVLGDSCLAATSTRYFSDRIFETVGRGAFCVHPYISGLAELLPDGLGVAYYQPDDLDEMGRLVDWWVAHDTERESARDAGQAFVRDNHTYEVRLASVLDTLKAEGAFGL